MPEGIAIVYQHNIIIPIQDIREGNVLEVVNPMNIFSRSHARAF